MSATSAATSVERNDVLQIETGSDEFHDPTPVRRRRGNRRVGRRRRRRHAATGAITADVDRAASSVGAATNVDVGRFIVVTSMVRRNFDVGFRISTRRPSSSTSGVFLGARFSFRRNLTRNGRILSLSLIHVVVVVFAIFFDVIAKSTFCRLGIIHRRHRNVTVAVVVDAVVVVVVIVVSSVVVEAFFR